MPHLPVIVSRTVIGTIVLAAAMGFSLNAQQLGAGAVVRWNDAPLGGRRVEAIVTGATADSLFLQAAGGPAFRIAPASNPTLEVRGDRNSRMKKALTGAAIGGGIGLITGIAVRNSCNDEYLTSSYFRVCDLSRSEYVAASTLGGALWGLLVGALISPSWQWHPLGARRTVGIRPLIEPGRVGLQIR